MERLAIIGAGEFGNQVYEYAKLQNKYDLVGFIDDFNSDNTFCELPILGKIEETEQLYNTNEFDCLFIAIGYSHLRFKYKLQQKLKHLPFATIIHPTATIEKNAIIQPGVLICANTHIGINTIIKSGAVIHLFSFVPHDNVIKECAFISSGVNIGGKSSIGKKCFLGIGSTITDSISICDEVVIGASSVALKSINSPGTYIGTPAKLLVK